MRLFLVVFLSWCRPDDIGREALLVNILRCILHNGVPLVIAPITVLAYLTISGHLAPPVEIATFGKRYISVPVC